MIPANYFPTHRSPCHPRRSSRHLTIPAVTPAVCRSPPDRIDRQTPSPLIQPSARIRCERLLTGQRSLVMEGSAGLRALDGWWLEVPLDSFTATDGLGPSSRLCLCARDAHRSEVRLGAPA